MSKVDTRVVSKNVLYYTCPIHGPIFRSLTGNELTWSIAIGNKTQAVLNKFRAKPEFMVSNLCPVCRAKNKLLTLVPMHREIDVIMFDCKVCGLEFVIDALCVDEGQAMCQGCYIQKHYIDCPTCKGTGKGMLSDKCPACSGSCVIKKG